MRILVIGTCQAIDMGRLLAAMLPEAEIEAREWLELREDAASRLVLAGLGGWDLVLVQPDANAACPALAEPVLRAVARRVRVVPFVVYSGLQPDMVYLRDGLWGPVGPYHSGLAAAAFLCGLSAREAEGLYNAYVFAELGYFSEAARSRQYFLERCRTVGFELAPHFDDWTRRGAFMHTMNHPRIDVLEDVLRMALALEEVAVPAEPVAGRVASVLEAGPVWPIYPPLARRLDVEGSWLFEFWRGTDGGRPTLDLPEFLAQSFACYAGCDQSALRTEHVAGLARTLKGILRDGYGSREAEAARRMVRALYHALLLREPDPGGLEAYAARLEASPDAVEAVARELAHSPEAVAILRRRLAEG